MKAPGETGWKLVHSMNPDLFCQMITMPLLEKHNVLTQVAGHHMDTVKILPPLIITKAEALGTDGGTTIE